MKDNKNIWADSIVTKAILKEVDKILSNPKEVDQWMGYLKKKESIFYMWMQKRAGGAISNMSHHIDLKIKDAEGVAYTILCAFLSSYIITHEISRKDVEEILRTPGQEYDAWAAGKLPDTWYNYSLEGLKKDSIKYTAKKTHLKRLKSAKDPAKERKAMKQFYLQIRARLCIPKKPIIRRKPITRKTSNEYNYNNFLEDTP